MNTRRSWLSGKPIRSAADAVASILFPAPCYVCRQPLGTASRIPICAACLNSLRRIESPICRQCGRPFPSGLGPPASPICRACARGIYGFDLARSLARYDRTLERVVTLLKYSPVAPLGSWLALEIEPVIRAEPVWEKVNWVVPVPLDHSRLRQRGYNQAELIARPLAGRLGLPIATNLLRRLRPRPAKQKLSRRERWETVRGAFEARPGSEVDNSRILLVDDVLTSGATLDACARTLRSAGAEAVYAVTVARVLPAWEVASRGATP
ncbi:MAG TPA: ComF family protein [Patescibacteria group bacterium]|nr:ComF family protein [Patescibacteria group bacterium]